MQTAEQIGGACPIRGGRSIQQGDGAAQVDVGLLQSGLSFCNARQNQAYVCIAWSGLRFCNARQKRRAQPYRKSQISPSALRRVRRNRSCLCAWRAIVVRVGGRSPKKDRGCVRGALRTVLVSYQTHMHAHARTHACNARRMQEPQAAERT